MDYMLNWEKQKQENIEDSDKDKQESSEFKSMIIFILVISALLIAVLLLR
ncbi:hypothetical protein G7074_25175 [Pedobacter sp. HDW13]|nr:MULTISPECIES: hypothetical protein [unclassified Pedobacter]QIL42259.1 hypothetical protein G7074_25175 [Pedobacter sp. HDW13]